jgi:hypothetical protein
MEILGKRIIDFSENPVRMAINTESHDPDLFKALREASHRMIRACGAAQIYYVLGDASNILQRAITIESLIKACSIIKGFEWLSEEEGWFWFGHDVPAENKLHFITRKILAVAGRKVDVEDILQGLIRNRRAKYIDTPIKVPAIEPTMTVALAVLARTPWLKVVQSDDLLPVVPLEVESCIQGAELNVFHFLNENNGVASRHSITKYLVDMHGMNLVTLNLVLDSSPIISRLDTGIFCLRGRSIDADAMKVALNTVWGIGTLANRAEKKLEVDHNGWVEFDLVISEYSIKRRMFQLPNYLRNFFESGTSLKMIGFDEPVIFRKYDNGECRINGVLARILKMGVKAGDTIHIKINQEKKLLIINNGVN